METITLLTFAKSTLFQCCCLRNSTVQFSSQKGKILTVFQNQPSLLCFRTLTHILSWNDFRGEKTIHEKGETFFFPFFSRFEGWMCLMGTLSANWVMLRYSSNSNPKSHCTTHNLLNDFTFYYGNVVQLKSN